MSLPVFSSPRDLCIHLEKHDYNIGSKIFIRAVQNKNAGLLLEELVVRLCRSRRTKDTSVSKVRGRAWLEVSDVQLKRDCFLTPSEVRTARQYLQKKGLIEVERTVAAFRYSINGNSLITALNRTLANSFPPAPPFQEITPGLSLGTTNTTSSNYSNYNLPPIVPPPKGSRIPEDFSPTFEMKAWARRRYPDLDLDEITESFVDYWKAVPGARGIKLDWEATWRNWIRNTWPKTTGCFNGGGKTRQPKNGWFTGDDVGFIN